MRQILLAPWELPGSLTAAQAALAMERGLRGAQPRWKVDRLPLASGGPGTLDLVLERVPGVRVHRRAVEGPLGGRQEARWLELPAGLAVLELAEASGVAPVPGTKKQPPVDASTFGTGQLILDALEKGCRRLAITVGGLTARDGAAGAAAALGVRFLDDRGRALPPIPSRLERLAAVDTSRRVPLLAHATLEIWTDPHGSPRDPAAEPGSIEHLMREEPEGQRPVLERLAELALSPGERRRLGHLGARAGGDFAYGLLAFAGATTFRPGFLALLELCGLERSLEACDLVLTCGGRLHPLDSQSASFWTLADLAQRHGKRTVAFVTSNELRPAAWRSHFHSVVSLSRPWQARAPVDDRALAKTVAAWAASAPRAQEGAAP